MQATRLEIFYSAQVKEISEHKKDCIRENSRAMFYYRDFRNALAIERKCILQRVERVTAGRY